MTNTLYTPANAILELPSYSNLIVGIEGFGGTGKTAAALTFPNPIIAVFEKPDLEGLLSLEHLRGVKPAILPFYSKEWLDLNKFPRFEAPRPATFRAYDPAGSFKTWLGGEGLKLTNQQTLVVDNWTRLSERYDEVNWGYDTITGRGEVDFRAPWDRKLSFQEELTNALIALNCNVVMIFHEIEARDKVTGEATGKLMPLSQGQFVMKLKTYYPNFFRAHVLEEKNAEGKYTGKRQFVWQVKHTAMFDPKCSRPHLMTPEAPALVDANYKTLLPPQS